ncbi:5-dehydro-4-deoxyglucarate dehydratase [Streptomonospora nanhaiensis]|uniref:Probable 5-dehydro-4-deoxyglucarate dehydratase n=1 Tax=Streptomonospora nanhaiensis TaxID=1323731 RepID=A0A853BGS4_9ACTN|nr:5-dehydro-4-deoxyglucarate dehydratase [Streptomonospora nanhaiensis]MBV2365029.1 5-dehydro-4-deoxyglucarate dehydratase [Streptomonospora nanhaiensis]MBX9388302.1 5-dehydro-4-deoxyglucarate dehydratase [Streptomonospora nanhaiensis]NYI94513.1 5-dehydro-4-deoxyglucarate dehydratase [Streptomonospora nanhaiensis]
MDFDGILFFPVTPFDRGGGLDEAALERHIASGLDHRPGGVFAACGTGEAHALSSAEHARVVRTAVAVAGGRVPVVAGAGGSLGTAVEQAAAARDLGADAILLLPPYLVGGTQRGLADYVRAVTSAVPIPAIVYQRGSLALTPQTAAEVAALPGVVGIKDGLGDLDRMARVVAAVRRDQGERFTFFNGLPTAEVTVPAYTAIGVPLYSSAAFAFVPEVATAFYRAFHAGDPLAETLLDVFYRPLAALRDRAPGYAVSLVKAGARLRGAEVGGVRPPFTDPTEDETARLAAIIDAGLAAVKEG